MTRARLTATAAALALVVVLAGGAAPPGAARPHAGRNVVVFGGHNEFKGFNVALSCCDSFWTNIEGTSEAIRGAFKQDDMGRWVYDLVSRASADASGVSYTIKPNAFWYWGGKKVPVTYRDFVYTLNKIDDRKSKVAGRAGYNQLDTAHFEHRGDKQVTFFWKKTNCSTGYPCGRYANWKSMFVQLYPSFALAGADFNTLWRDCICGSDGRPVSNGPFYLAHYDKVEGTTLKANPYYYATPKLAEVDFRFTTDQLEDQAMVSGQVDAILPLPQPEVARLFEGAPGIDLDHVPGFLFEHLALREGNAKAAPSVKHGASSALLSAPWMRRAIMLGINRERIIAAVFGRLSGGIVPLESALFLPTQTGYGRAFQQWNYNPSQALAILKKHCTAGSGPSVPSAANASIWQCAGVPATFNWTWGVGHDEWATSERLARADLQSIGIRIEERPSPAKTGFGRIIAGNFDITQFRWIDSGDPGDFYDIYRCYGDSNFTGYCNSRVDALLKAAQNEPRPNKRERLYQRADAILAADVAVIPMYQVPVVLVHRSDLLGMHATRNGDPTWNIEDWHWRN